MSAFQAENVGSIPTTRIFQRFPGEMVDTLDLKSDAARRNGSSPLGSILKLGFIFVISFYIKKNQKLIK